MISNDHLACAYTVSRRLPTAPVTSKASLPENDLVSQKINFDFQKWHMANKSPRIAIMLDLQWPYKRHADIFAGIQSYAESHHWDSIIDEFAHNTLRDHPRKFPPYDGIIARANLQLATQAKKCRVPLVNVWPSSPARHVVSGVYPDSVAVGRQIAEHLLSRGFRSFATLTAHHNAEHHIEVAEFARMVNEAGFTCVSQLIPQNPWLNYTCWRKTEALIEQWIGRLQPPVGVYVGNDGCGRLVAQACRRHGLQVPADVAIIAGKNQETLCDHPRPTLTSMEIGYERIGYEAAKLLDELIQGKPPPTTPLLLPPQGLFVRESTDFLAVNNDVVSAALRFISANSHRSIGPNEVATAVGMETRTLQNYFRRVIDRPIAAEIRRMRIERAKRELVQSDRPLADIARDSGFGESIRMCEVFRRELGMTPSEYRQQRQPKPRPD